MVRVLVCKNDGCFEFAVATVDNVGTWGDVKMQLARILYSEEELFAIDSPGDVALYALSSGDNLEAATEEDAASHVTEDSRWALDIFCCPLRRMSDLMVQTDRAIRGLRRTSASVEAGRSPTTFQSIYSPNASADRVSAPATYQEPYVHIGTWTPLVIKDHKVPVISSALHASLRPNTAEYEDVLLTTNRARDYIAGFRRMGKPVTILSMQTVTLPLAAACPSAISQLGMRVLYEGAYQLSESDAQRGFVQAVRLWFSFDCEQTVTVTKAHGALGLKPLRQQDGWIVVQAVVGSPAFEAGMRGQEVFLTHVNGVDVSPHAFPSVGTQFAANVSWKDAVVPLVENSETCIFTFF